MPAHIAIDARFNQNPISGIGRYTLNLLEGIAQIRPRCRLTVLTSPSALLPPAILESDVFSIVSIPGRPQRLGDQLMLWSALRRLNVDLLHSPDAFIPLFWSGITVLTIHDLIPLLWRKALYAGIKSRFAVLWRLWLQLQCSRARAILTVSHQSAGDLKRLLHISAARIHVVHNGVGSLPTPDAEQREKIRSMFRLTGKIILYVGRRDPTKNLALLVRAFAILRGRLGSDVKLVLAGQPDNRYREAEREAERCGVDARVVHTGHLSETLLAALYCEADILALPSIYEGFGLTALEAMHFGTPVIASNLNVFSEVFGNAALLVDLASDEAWAQAMQNVLTDDRLSQSLRAKGLNKAGQLTARDQATGTIELYNQLLEANR